MKLLFVCPDWFPYSAGLAQSCLEICKSLEEQGHKVKIIVAKDEGLDKKGMKVVAIPYLFRLLGRNPIPFLYWNHIKQHVAWADKVCLFSYMYEMNSRIVLYKKLGLFNKPLIHFYRGSLEEVPNLSFITRMAKKLWDITLGKLMFTSVDLTISNSKPTIQYIQKKYGVSKRKLSYIPTGISFNTYTPSFGENKRVIFIGRLIENKGIKHFSNFLKVIPKSWTFTIIGDGPLREEVISLQKKYDNVEFVGKVAHQKVKQYLSESDILILPSYAEGSPRAVLEAGASKVCSISYDVGDIPSILPKELTIPVGNESRFLTVLEQLIKNKQKRKQYSKEIYTRLYTDQNNNDIKTNIEKIISKI